MKRTIHSLFAAVALLSFLYVQVPFGLFHHHHHEPVCELSAHHDHGGHADGETHLHEYESHECFTCSAQLSKEYSMLDFSFRLFVSEIKTAYPDILVSDAIRVFFHSSSRAPPAVLA
ncbi:MAG: hypothetical protein AB1458_02805 [Bacteroidota bacterium]